MLKAFDTVKPTQATADKMAALRADYSTLAEKILATVPTSRERALAITELEASAMWAIKALTHNQPDDDGGNPK